MAKPSVAVIDGKARGVVRREAHEVGKGHEALLSDALKTREFDKNREDELYAWSNIRSQYNASLTYQAARSAYSSGDMVLAMVTARRIWYGYNGFYGQGWYWSNGFNSWLWMPGGQFFSPFGWGFYGPGYVMGRAGGGGAGRCRRRHRRVKPILPVRPRPMQAGASGITVPVNPKQIPAIGVYAKSPASFAAAVRTARASTASGGLRTSSGMPAARRYSSGGGSMGGQSSGGGHASVSSLGGSGMSSGAAHAGGGGKAK